jgi:hypothetical protein
MVFITVGGKTSVITLRSFCCIEETGDIYGESPNSYFIKCKGKAIPLQALTSPEGSRRLRLPDFKTSST